MRRASALTWRRLRALAPQSNASSSRAGQPSALALRQLAPALLADLDAELLRRRHDALPRSIALGIGHALDLVEARDRVADVARILERLLALVRECKVLAGQVVTVVGLQSGHLDLLDVGRGRARPRSVGKRHARSALGVTACLASTGRQAKPARQAARYS